MQIDGSDFLFLMIECIDQFATVAVQFARANGAWLLCVGWCCGYGAVAWIWKCGCTSVHYRRRQRYWFDINVYIGLLWMYGNGWEGKGQLVFSWWYNIYLEWIDIAGVFFFICLCIDLIIISFFFTATTSLNEKPTDWKTVNKVPNLITNTNRIHLEEHKSKYKWGIYSTTLTI